MKKNIQLSLDNSDFSDKKILIVKTKWNEEIIEPMVEDCMKVLENHEVNFSTFTVPGAFEIPFMVSEKIESFDAAIPVIFEFEIQAITLLERISICQLFVS